MKLCWLDIYVNIGCLNIHGTDVTAQLFLLTHYIHGTYVAANNSSNDNTVFIFVSELKIVYYNNY